MNLSGMAVPVLMMVFGLITGAAQAQPTPEEEPGLLSAFFGLDNALPRRIAGLCLGGGGQDGMPVILSQVINPDTLQPEDFAVITESGEVNTPRCAILEPAVDPGELRTVLLIGELGDAETDPPVRVEVVGEILTENDADFFGASVDVTPLEAGPFLVLAESVPSEQWRLDQPSGRRQGDGCPSDGTVQVVRVTWSGGVSNAEGEEAGEPERGEYRVMLRLADRSEAEITPFALADLGDGDNNHLLCLDQQGEPLSVSFPAGHLLDPNEDTLNPETNVPVQPLPAAAT